MGLANEPLADSRLQPLDIRGLLLLLASPVCLFINPYGFEIITYYRETLLNPAFAQVVTEWEPVTSIMPLAIPYFLVAVATVWVMGRSGRRMPAFDQVTLLVLCAGGVFAIRNIVWFGLAVTILLPGAVGRILPAGGTTSRRATLNLSLAAVSLVAVAAATVAVGLRPSSWFERTYSARALATVTRLADKQPNVRIYADNRFADWLLWHDPRLAGRIAYDIRFELLTKEQLQTIVDVAALPRPHEATLLNRYGLLVLDPNNPATTQRLLARRGTHAVLRSDDVDVAQRAPHA